ncbi:hypothetical protein ACJX0J_039105, partial [Zea mays]
GSALILRACSPPPLPARPSSPRPTRFSRFPPLQASILPSYLTGGCCFCTRWFISPRPISCYSRNRLLVLFVPPSDLLRNYTTCHPVALFVVDTPVRL